MGSLFDDAMEVADAGPITGAFGEPIFVQPRLRSVAGRPPAVDILRVSATAQGVFLQKGAEKSIFSFKTGAPGNVILDSFEAHVWFAKTELEALGFTPDKDDLVVVRGISYSVVSGEESDIGDVLINLVREDR